MADKKIKAQLKILIKAGAANPAPPVGSTLGPYGLNLVQFCKEFNDKTSGMQGMVPVEVTIFEDRTYQFILKTPPVAELIKQALKIQSGAGNPLKDTVGTLSQEQIAEIAEKKMPDLNSHDIESAKQQVVGTCKSMGVKVAA
jgi:large subunit ribosomal protein L11